MAPIFLHVKIQFFKQYYFKYLVGSLHLKLYQFVYENLNNNSLQYYFHICRLYDFNRTTLNYVTTSTIISN